MRGFVPIKLCLERSKRRRDPSNPRGAAPAAVCTPRAPRTPGSTRPLAPLPGRFAPRLRHAGQANIRSVSHPPEAHSPEGVFIMSPGIISRPVAQPDARKRPGAGVTAPREPRGREPFACQGNTAFWRSQRPFRTTFRGPLLSRCRASAAPHTARGGALAFVRPGSLLLAHTEHTPGNHAAALPSLEHGLCSVHAPGCCALRPSCVWEGGLLTIPSVQTLLVRPWRCGSGR